MTSYGEYRETDVAKMIVKALPTIRPVSSAGQSHRLLSGRSQVRILYRVPYGHIAQLGEHLICIQNVAGSSPVMSTNWLLSSVVRTPGC